MRLAWKWDVLIMARKYFGTDGIRGLANGEKLTPELAMRVGMAFSEAALASSAKNAYRKSRAAASRLKCFSLAYCAVSALPR